LEAGGLKPERKEGGAEETARRRDILHGVAFTHLTQDQLQTLRTFVLGQAREPASVCSDLPSRTQPQEAKGSPIQGGQET
jgi:hypothetical protein